MTRLAEIDPTAFNKYPEPFIGLFFSSICSFEVELELRYIETMFGMPGCLDHPIFEGLSGIGPSFSGMTLEGHQEKRLSVLDGMFPS